MYASKTLLLISVITCVVGLLANVNSANAQSKSMVKNLPRQLTKPAISIEEFALRLTHYRKAELADIAKEWLNISRSSVKRVAELKIALSSAEEAEKARLRSELDVALGRRSNYLRKLDVILDEWSAKGGAEKELLEYRNYSLAVIRRGLKQTNTQIVADIAWDWLKSSSGGLGILKWLGLIIISLIFMSIVSMLLSIALGRAIAGRFGISNLLRNYLSKSAYWIIFTIGAIVTLSMFGINMTPVLAAFGGAGFIVEFALQNTLSNLVSGLLLMINRPFDVGDDVDVAGIIGVVMEVNSMSTIIRDEGGQKSMSPTRRFGTV